MQETQVQSLGRGDPLEEGMEPTPVFLPGESPWTEEPDGLQSIGLQKVGHNWACMHAIHAAAAAAAVLQSCPTLCDPIDGNPPGSPIPGILQARTLEWVAIAFSVQYMNTFLVWKNQRYINTLRRLKYVMITDSTWMLGYSVSLSVVSKSEIPWTVAHQAPLSMELSMGFSR